MQLDKFSDYALRILMVLAVKAPERVSTRQIADIFDISENHLGKIATALAREEFVTSQRGRMGGLSLAQPPAEISVGQVLRRIKDTTPVAECFGNHNTCHIAPACGLRGPLQEAQEAFYATLDGYVLAELVRDRSGLGVLMA